MSTRAGQASYRDRTQEFLKAVENCKKSFSSTLDGPSSSTAPYLEGPKSAASIQSEFNRRASQIGLGIHQTSQKLAKLAKLAKRTSVFDDPTIEIQELTSVIKKDITALNSAVVDLQLLCSLQNESGNMSRDTTNHSTTVVDNLKNRLMSATKEFKEVLTMRTENLKVHESRRQLFSSSASKEAANPFLRQRPLVSKGSNDSSAPPAPWENGSTSSSPLFPRFLLVDRRKSNGDPAEFGSLSPFQTLIDRARMSGNGAKKVVEVAVKASKSIDWDGMAKLLVSAEAHKEFANLRRAFDDVNHQLQTKFSLEPEPIDWDYYRKRIGSHLVDQYKEAYDGIEIPKFVDTVTPEYKPKFDALLVELKEAEKKSLERSAQLEKEIAEVQEMKKKIATMTADEYFEKHPELRKQFDDEIRNDNWGY